MKNQDEFRVLVIDDKASVLQALRAKLDGPRGRADPDLKCNVKVATVHVKVVNESGHREVSSSVVDDLAEAASRSPDLIIIDYFYVSPEVVPTLIAELQGGTLTKQRLLSQVLQPRDLVQHLDSFPTGDGRRTQIMRNVFGAKCPVYLHSYTPDGMSLVAGPVEDRRRGLSRVFPNAEFIGAVDTRREIFNDGSFSSFHDSEYYPYQLATYFNVVVDKEVLRRRLKQSRFLRIRRSALSVTAVASIGGGIGLAGSWIGSYIADAFEAGDFLAGSVVGAASLLLLLLLGMLCPFVFERLMKRLLPAD